MCCFDQHILGHAPGASIGSISFMLASIIFHCALRTCYLGLSMQFLFQIDDVFVIPGRGCILVPGVPFAFPVIVRAGTRIVIVSPAGERLDTVIAGCEMINRGIPSCHAPICLPRNVRKEMLALGSRVYLAQSGGQQSG